jgi:hypothetical protein
MNLSCARFLSILLFILCEPAFAQDMPAKGNLSQMISKLDKRLPTDVEFSATDQPVVSACKLQQFNVKLSRSTGAQRTYSILSDPDVPGSSRRNILAVVNGRAVDADGSPRAYHPADPNGSGTCTLNSNHAGNHFPSGSGICALDTISDGGVAVFKGTTQLKDSELADDWRQLWSLIENRKLSSLDLTKVSGTFLGLHYYFFYWKQMDMTVFFKDENIRRTSDGYPCIRKSRSRFSGYFVSATSLNHDRDHAGAEVVDPSDVAPTECHALRDIDAETVPYFVIPGGTLGQAAIGDIVVARVKIGDNERIVYGVAADRGPIKRFGEGSVAFNQLLLGKTGPVINSAALDELDIRDIPVTVLILGGTRHLLKGDFSRANIETIGPAEFTRWGGPGTNPTKRLSACIAQAKVNGR